MGVITFSLGAVRLQGDGVETAMRQKIKDGDAFMQRYQQIRENKRRFAEMDDIRKYTSDAYTLNPDSKINYTPKTLAEITPEDVIGEYWEAKSITSACCVTQHLTIASQVSS